MGLNDTFGIFLTRLLEGETRAPWSSSSGYREENAPLHAASLFCGLGRGSVAPLGAPGRLWGHREDLPLALRVFWGPGGLQSAEEGPNSREDPGMDGHTVSPARCVAALWLLL